MVIMSKAVAGGRGEEAHLNTVCVRVCVCLSCACVCVCVCVYVCVCVCMGIFTCVGEASNKESVTRQYSVTLASRKREQAHTHTHTHTHKHTDKDEQYRSGRGAGGADEGLHDSDMGGNMYFTDHQFRMRNIMYANSEHKTNLRHTSKLLIRIRDAAS
jgi:hypothetical protein